jgi:hypothetical protein
MKIDATDPTQRSMLMERVGRSPDDIQGFKLKNGELHTQSAIGKFFQNLGDAFRLNPKGLEHIRQRNDNLKEAIAEQLRGKVYNPGVNFGADEAKDAVLNMCHSKFLMDKTLRGVPEPRREEVRAVLTDSLAKASGIPDPTKSKGLVRVFLAGMDTEGLSKLIINSAVDKATQDLSEPARGKVRAALSDHLKENAGQPDSPEFYDKVDQLLAEAAAKDNFGLTLHNKFLAQKELIAKHQEAVKTAFQAELTRGIKAHHTENPVTNIHKAFLKDCPRTGSVIINGKDLSVSINVEDNSVSINGKVLSSEEREAVYGEAIMDMMPGEDKAAARYIATTIAQQGGSAISLFYLIAGEGNPDDATIDAAMGLPEGSGVGIFGADGKPAFSTTPEQIKLEKHDDHVLVQCTMSAGPILLNSDDGGVVGDEGISTKLTMYTVTVKVPFAQPGGIDNPTFTVEGVTVSHQHPAAEQPATA